MSLISSTIYLLATVEKQLLLRIYSHELPGIKEGQNETFERCTYKDIHTYAYNQRSVLRVTSNLQYLNKSLTDE